MHTERRTQGGTYTRRRNTHRRTSKQKNIYMQRRHRRGGDTDTVRHTHEGDIHGGEEKCA